MRTLLFALVLFAATAPQAGAQQAPYVPSDIRTVHSFSEDMLLSTGGAAAGVASAFLVGGLAHVAGAPEAVGYPLGIAAGLTGMAIGVHGTAELLGIDGSLSNAIGDAWTGGALGAATMGATYLIISAMAADGTRCDGLLCIDPEVALVAVVGAGTAITLPLAWVVSDYRSVAPTVMYGRDGEAALGLSVTVGL